MNELNNIGEGEKDSKLINESIRFLPPFSTFMTFMKSSNKGICSYYRNFIMCKAFRTVKFFCCRVFAKFGVIESFKCFIKILNFNKFSLVFLTLFLFFFLFYFNSYIFMVKAAEVKISSENTKAKTYNKPNTQTTHEKPLFKEVKGNINIDMRHVDKTPFYYGNSIGLIFGFSIALLMAIAITYNQSNVLNNKSKEANKGKKE